MGEVYLWACLQFVSILTAVFLADASIDLLTYR